ncbi:hypothetical protein FRC19_001920 [Serendipita sp. 401]|nr:hypothetical protein FRC19_001920 [Serendipita sp. 401]
MLPIAPYISDGFGRNRALTLGCFTIIGGVILQALATTVGHFIASRCIVGVGICLIQNAAPVLIAELAYPTQRGTLTALYNTMWYFGSIISAWVCYATLRTLPGSIWEWRLVGFPQEYTIPPVVWQRVFTHHFQHLEFPVYFKLLPLSSLVSSSYSCQIVPDGSLQRVE